MITGECRISIRRRWPNGSGRPPPEWKEAGYIECHSKAIQLLVYPKVGQGHSVACAAWFAQRTFQFSSKQIGKTPEALSVSQGMTAGSVAAGFGKPES